MTKQAQLGPIDPSVNTPLNPQLPGEQPNVRVPVSVEDINGFLEFAKQSMGDSGNIQGCFDRLAQSVHPIVLGKAFRARSQIRMLGKRLLSFHLQDEDNIDKILRFLCGESGSHDYTINRREARDSLGLNVESPSQQLYELIKSIYDDIASDLQLNVPFDLHVAIGNKNSNNYKIVRALIESTGGGSHCFMSEGVLTKTLIKMQTGLPGEAIQDTRLFEGWRHYND